ncbi:alpha-1,2-mannosyltransferase [Punctularia strigosozonata HHB-11173 SS5]|uniref:alpha-1,2-mannosyltransferase n=1 Tax=Punctularia strigosozonata (strain HHB-11173) TaxID=741275 RepID=UPI00044184DD|nr:alpha-1,2-mannosyltransferase [Punctularia strigosozonata HHB-11173 SS5]EIN06518.1 alpha-1,2-mannosyltransferase [Punctularia strigosozonata HHB-11173 SS5]
MNTTTRYILAVALIIVALHSLLSVTHEEYGRATSLSKLASQWPSISGHKDPPKAVPDDYYIDAKIDAKTGELLPVSTPRMNATILMLARNSDTDSVIKSVRELEDRFNRKFGYPWTFMNEEPFTEDFKKRVSVLLSSPAEFITIPHDDWFQPEWIDESKAEAGRNKLVEESVIYGGSVSYRNMCRFNSGFFYRQAALQKYRWYWRVEYVPFQTLPRMNFDEVILNRPDVHFHCDIDFDPFRFMEDNNKTYAFTITMYEFDKTIPTLWETTKNFIKENPQYVARDNLMGFLSDNNGDTYNLCHFWSNFEIADMNFWRSPAYEAYFDYLEKAGGFYYERWGDAPVHSIAVALFQQKDQVHFFDEIGYEHNPYTHCPKDETTWKKRHCSCDQGRSFDYDGYSCMRKWEAVTS